MPIRCVAASFAVLLAITPAPVRAQSPDFLLQWGSQGTGQGQFISPYGIAIDPSGFVYVADQYNHRIQKFTPDGVFVTAWGSLGQGPGQFEVPLAVAIDASAKVYVVDGSTRVQTFATDGTFVREWHHPSQYASLLDVAVDAAGYVYVTDHGLIDVFSPTGDFVRSIGQGETRSVACVAVDRDGNVFAGVDFGPSTLEIVKFDPAGNVLTRWGQPGSGDGQFNSPVGLAVDEFGQVLVADYRNNRVQIFTNSGAFVGKWGREGTGPGEFRQPVHIAPVAGGRVYVVDLLNNRVQKFGSLPTVVAQKTWGEVKATYR